MTSDSARQFGQVAHELACGPDRTVGVGFISGTGRIASCDLGEADGCRLAAMARDAISADGPRYTAPMRLGPVLATIALVGCGRYGFDDLAGGDGRSADGSVPDDGAGDGAFADGPQARSCDGLPSTCGPGGTGSCCESPIVVGGVYFRSYDGTALYADTSAAATVSDFRLDRYEVTVARFRAFAAAGRATLANPPLAGAGAHPNIPGSGWDATWNASLVVDSAALGQALQCGGSFATWTTTPGANESRPINCVSSYETMAFCAWDGGFLPTEAEWNYAASGGSEQRAYPWSNPPTSVLIDESFASYSVMGFTDCRGDGISGCAPTDILVPGSKPAGDGRWGQSDLAGNVHEWTLDFAAPGGTYPVPCVDCARLVPNINKMVRGGAYQAPFDYVRLAARFLFPPNARNPYVGFRCARSP